MAAMIGSSTGSCLSGAISMMYSFFVFVWFQLGLWPLILLFCFMFGRELVTCIAWGDSSGGTDRNFVDASTCMYVSRASVHPGAEHNK